MRSILVVVGFFAGLCLGFRLMLPPPAPDPHMECGLPAMVAIFFGAPMGAILGGLAGWTAWMVIDTARGLLADAAEPQPRWWEDEHLA